MREDGRWRMDTGPSSVFWVLWCVERDCDGVSELETRKVAELAWKFSMTAQFCDQMEYRGKQFSIAGKNGTGLFEPTQHGLNPVWRCSACWRGFVCSYALVADCL